MARHLHNTDDEEWQKEKRGRVLDATLLMGWVLLPYTLLLEFDGLETAPAGGDAEGSSARNGRDAEGGGNR